MQGTVATRQNCMSTRQWSLNPYLALTHAMPLLAELNSGRLPDRDIGHRDCGTPGLGESYDLSSGFGSRRLIAQNLYRFVCGVRLLMSRKSENSRSASARRPNFW